MSRKFLTGLGALILCALPCISAHAMEEMTYSDFTGSVAMQSRLQSYISEHYENNVSEYKFSRVDLNGDGIDELVSKKRKCLTVGTQYCEHSILAQTNDAILNLGNITAKHIITAGTSSHGIRDILAFKNQLNDYDFEIYVWSPAEKKYILKAK